MPTDQVLYWPWYVNLAALALVIVAPIWLGRGLARRWRMPDYAGKFSFVLFTLFAGVVVAYYGWSTNHIQLGIDLKGGSYLVYQVMEAEGASDQDADQPAPTRRSTAATRAQVDMDKLVASLRRRVDPSGVLGVKIRAYGTRQIEIKVPQVDQVQVDHLKKKIAEVGTLEFRILATDRRSSSPNFKAYILRAKAMAPDQKQLLEERTGDEAPKVLARWVPVLEGKEGEFDSLHHPSKETVQYATREVADRKGRKQLEVLVFQDDWNVTGEYLTRAAPGESRGQPCVTFMFDSRGAAKFGRLTGYFQPDKVQGIWYHLGIILDGKLITAPRINSPIFDRGEITGGFDQARAQELVDVLNAGALPAALSPQPISERTTGPELGQDTIQSGKLSIFVALALVFVGVLFYYRFAGIVACIALAMNAVMLLACMIIINAEFSLAGIAGFALSIAMAVDANVLIYERMREEAGRGAALRMTIRNGFERALSAIVDSNLTTLITAVILYAIGSDQVRGFAVTLFLGIVLSMYTAIIVARVIFDVAERRRWIERVKMLRALPPTHFNFLRYKWPMIGISLTIITIGLIATFVRGRGILDIDFTGGVSVETVFNGNPDIAHVRKALESVPEAERLPDVTVREITRSERATTDIDKIEALVERIVVSGLMSAQELTDFQASQPAEGRPKDAQELAAALVKAGKLTEAQAGILRERRSEERKTFIIDASNPSGENPEQYRETTVKQSLERVFGDQLAHNHMKIFDVAPIPSAAILPSPVSGEGVGVRALVSGEGVGVRGSRGLLVGTRPELFGLSAALVGQGPPAKADTAADAAKKETAPAKESAAGAPASAPAKSPAAAAPLPAETTPKPPAAAAPLPAEATPKPPAAAAPSPAETTTKPPAPAESKAPAQPGVESPGAPSAPKLPAPVLPPKPPVVDPFAGGTKTWLSFDQGIDHSTLEALFTKVIQAQLKEKAKLAEFDLTVPVYEEGSLGRFSSWYVKIKLPPAQAEPIFKAVAADLQSTPFFPSSDTIGGEVAKQTRTHALFALAASTFFILLYLWVRFQRIAYGVGAVASLIHDVFIALAFVAISYYVAPFFGFLMVEPFKINVIMMTSFLTLAGYSLNDTIVIFDRIREVRGKAPQVTEEMINSSINQCLGRTLLTGLVSIMVILTLYILGGPTIHGFAYAMTVGVITGMYSSVYIAAPFLLWVSRSAEKR